MAQRAEVDRKCQYVQGVLYASDQYGPSTSISYTAMNLIGRPENYPDFDEFVNSYMLTTHGEWWREVPSFYPEFGLSNVPASQNPPVTDFIVVSFEDPVFPLSLEVYETFNPGAIRRVWAFTPAGSVKWELLWTRTWADVCLLTRAPVFKENLIKIKTPVRVIRLEFDTTHLQYIPGYDGMLLCGLADRPSECGQGDPPALQPLADDVSRTSSRAGTINITELAAEMLLNIFSFLDIWSLSSVERVCQKFNLVARDPGLFRAVNLRPYWMLVNTARVQWLAARCTGIRKLDVSWCGMFDANFAASVHRLLLTCGKAITHLRLDDIPVPFTGEQLCGIADHCPSLKEVSLRQMQLQPPPEQLSFINLTRLNVARTAIGTECLVHLLPRNPQLQHLNVTCCLNVDLQELVTTITKHNRELISLNLWKAGELLPAGLRTLQVCTKLRELDLGWTIPQDRLDGALGDVLKSCPGMLKLGLAGLRGLQDADVVDIVKYCRQLQQLDLMGCISVTGSSVDRVFYTCCNLRFVDINHCERITNAFLMDWDMLYSGIFQFITRAKMIDYHSN
uniref:F-box domain-containing protein n=1 Tax=Anopheles atroparvus TaxID=41427 RepID=A0AAG5DW31_ANOAO